MATRTVTRGDFIKPYRVGSTRIVHRPDTASTTFLVGDPLIFGATAGHEDRITIAGSDPAYITGFAAENASGVVDTDISIWAADGEAEFIGVVQDSGALDQLQIGASYGLVADGTNHIWRVDLTETTATVVQITKLIDADGDVNGRVVFRVLYSARKPLGA